jgi:hypothetical protein
MSGLGESFFDSVLEESFFDGISLWFTLTKVEAGFLALTVSVSRSFTFPTLFQPRVIFVCMLLVELF